MSKMRPITWVAAVVVALSGAAVAWGQGAPVSPGSDHFWKFQPFLDPGHFEPDFQFFAPAEVDDFGGEEHANTGLYVTFDRTYVGVSRPDDAFSFGSGNQADFTWGNRMEVGYMQGDPSGWQAVLWHINGPNEKFTNAEFLESVTNLDGSAAFQILSPGAQDSINQLKLSSFELNKVWRRPAFHNGTNFEPFLGYRYMNLRDFWQREILIREVQGGAPLTDTGTEFFERQLFKSVFENQMHGGQFGARFFQQRGHWMLSADLRFFATANFQTLQNISARSITPNPQTILVDGDTAQNFINFFGSGTDLNRSVNYRHETQFVFGGEVRVEASYELTRDINLRVGGVFFDLGQGIGRGNQMRFNNQDVQIAGVTFGVTVNR